MHNVYYHSHHHSYAWLYSHDYLEFFFVSIFRLYFQYMNLLSYFNTKVLKVKIIDQLRKVFGPMRIKRVQALSGFFFRHLPVKQDDFTLVLGYLAQLSFDQCLAKLLVLLCSIACSVQVIIHHIELSLGATFFIE